VVNASMTLNASCSSHNAADHRPVMAAFHTSAIDLAGLVAEPAQRIRDGIGKATTRSWWAGSGMAQVPVADRRPRRRCLATPRARRRASLPGATIHRWPVHTIRWQSATATRAVRARVASTSKSTQGMTKCGPTVP
jgi:hypothetical protein